MCQTVCETVKRQKVAGAADTTGQSRVKEGEDIACEVAASAACEGAAAVASAEPEKIVVEIKESELSDNCPSQGAAVQATEPAAALVIADESADEAPRVSENLENARPTTPGGAAVPNEETGAPVTTRMAEAVEVMSNEAVPMEDSHTNTSPPVQQRNSKYDGKRRKSGAQRRKIRKQRAAAEGAGAAATQSAGNVVPEPTSGGEMSDSSVASRRTTLKNTVASPVWHCSRAKRNTKQVMATTWRQNRHTGPGPVYRWTGVAAPAAEVPAQAAAQAPRVNVTAQAPASETVSEETAIKFTTELPVSGFAAGNLTAFQVTSFILSVIIALQGLQQSTLGASGVHVPVCKCGSMLGQVGGLGLGGGPGIGCQ